jgi:hypothetical protein
MSDPLVQKDSIDEKKAPGVSAKFEKKTNRYDSMNRGFDKVLAVKTRPTKDKLRSQIALTDLG